MRFLRVTGAGGTGGGQRGGSLPGPSGPDPPQPPQKRPRRPSRRRRKTRGAPQGAEEKQAGARRENRGNSGSGWYARRPCLLCPGIDVVSRARAAFILVTLTFAAWLVPP